MTKFTFEFTHIDGREDLATARGTFAMTAEIDGTEVAMSGKFIDTLSKGSDNSWRFKEIIWNLDHPA